MKKVLSITLSIVFAVTAFAQQKDVTKFLGIPVDGTKAEMIEKLKAKGFKLTYYKDYVIFKGQFNGQDVNIHIGTNNNKVYRIMVCDANTQNAANIKIRFNNLCNNFNDNKKYISALSSSNQILDNEDIGYEMLINKKRYDAYYYQLPQPLDIEKIDKDVFSILSSKYTEAQLSNPTEEIQNEINSTRVDCIYNDARQRVVWFTISEFNREYYITLYYDNEYNKAHGEDL